MIALNEILIRRVSKNDLSKVIDLLQEISVYNPPKKKLESIWERYSNQQNIFGYCFFFNDKLIGYGSINLEMKLKK
jgi:hypothetical protein